MGVIILKLHLFHTIMGEKMETASMNMRYRDYKTSHGPDKALINAWAMTAIVIGVILLILIS